MKTATVTRSPNGNARHEKPLDQIVIPDLWHIAQAIKAKFGPEVYREVIDTWHLAHDLLTHAKEVHAATLTRDGAVVGELRGLEAADRAAGWCSRCNNTRRVAALGGTGERVWDVCPDCEDDPVRENIGGGSESPWRRNS